MSGTAPAGQHLRQGVADVGPQRHPIAVHRGSVRGDQVEVGQGAERETLERAVGADELGDEVVGRAGEDLGRRGVLGQAAALAQDGDPVAHLDRLVDVVGDEDDRLAHPGLEAEELVLEALAADRVDRPERLVHEHQRRVGGQGPGHADALALAAGELRRVAVAHLLRVHPDQLEQLVGALGHARLVPAEQARDGRDVLGDRQVREEADLLDDVADLLAQVVGRPVEHAAPAEEDVAAGERDHPVDQAHRRGLAAPRRPDEHAHLAGRNLERQALDRRVALARDSAWWPRGTRASRPARTRSTPRYGRCRRYPRSESRGERPSL